MSAPVMERFPAVAGELVIAIELGRVEYIGTRAQLEDSGVVPGTLAWPKGRDWAGWQSGGLDYSLRRRRPEGHKGPMRTWVEGDNWVVRVEVMGWNHARRVQREKTEALRRAQYQLSEEGSRQWADECRRAADACYDRSFQAFKASIPGLVRQRRSRKPAAQ